MFQENGRKIKLLELKRLLEEETDAEHGLNATQISERLKAKGISAGIKAIYDDIHALNYFYQPADKRKAARAPHIELDENGGGYYLDNRLFSVADLKLIIDAVKASRFLTEQKTTGGGSAHAVLPLSGAIAAA